MNRIRHIHCLFFLFVLASVANAQSTHFSIATDLDMLRSFKKEQQFWAIGQTIHAHFHLTPKDGLYAWVSYYSNGKFNNRITATAKSATTTPQQIDYSNSSFLRYRHISLGYKRYLKGRFDSEDSWNLYAFGGFGILPGKIQNSHSVPIDTALYNVPVRRGNSGFKRLTIDAGLGLEFPIGANMYIYSEGKTWLPASDYPSKYLFVNNNAPIVGILAVGLRILID